ncbi:hypothetical protein CLAFUW4_01532 [Fulvia fulva]|uniref:Uncharacterized protein n=1 Tax=Passalora fulva TaxID=5499 RepID=A0A9Q8P3X8_PASFU|nr:uncharacterized protein CLAFUR5_01534 [Fulvia fulva]KAK4636051.1 hypothetical protein CLAFUR4_01533 [Fulvia fulva]KAK4636837.1 hypothetical protein CLAFUR0_01534 [Fulvia fulva]UJO12152.1 hypothetical protein CLAFUR5_01534 [Fulvia fulva]WPV08620.1 hypothetical protein CLAFUW4_01532 [Fulvia fulva]WPV24746.1 hypothetical protein CLAFUW7_01537 [Fulvia fulva]
MKSSETRTSARPSQRRRRPRATFYDLPGELRNKVYRLELVKDRTIYLDADQLELLQQGNPALLRSSDRINKECQRIYFEENIFCFTDQSLNGDGISIFRHAMGDAFEYLQQIKVSRTYRIGDMRPITIRFRAYTQSVTEGRRTRTRIIIERPQNENLPFPGIRSKMRGKFKEPCRCEVDAMARSWQFPGESGGWMLFSFLEEYIQYITSTAEHAQIETCKKCNSVRRT